MKALMSVPVIGWFLGLLLAAAVSIPFYFLWNALAPTYFYFLPEVYKHIPFGDCVGLFIIVPILKETLNPFRANINNQTK
jgi:hypothetical protein